MANEEQKDDPQGGSGPGNYIKFTGMGFQMIAIIGLFAWGGSKIDEAGHHSVKWATATLSLIGVFISLYLVIRAIKE